MKYSVKVDGIKSFNEFDLEIELNPGLNLVCGENGIGKSTLLQILAFPIQDSAQNSLLEFAKRDFPEDSGSCKSESKRRIEYDLSNEAGTTLFRRSYFLEREQVRETIHFLIGGGAKVARERISWKFDRKTAENTKKVKGFFEAAFPYGDRFLSLTSVIQSGVERYKEDQQSSLPQNSIDPRKISTQTDSFIVKNLGKILRDDESFYEGKLCFLKGSSKIHKMKLPYLLDYGTGYITSHYMSLGERVVLTLLNYVTRLKKIQQKKRKDENISSNTPVLFLVDEIEQGLHPSATLRLLEVLKRECENENIEMIMSSHSLEIIRAVSPENTIYLELDSSRKTIYTPNCYPAYITKQIYTDGIDIDVLFLLEDSFAKNVLDAILRSKQGETKIECGQIPVGASDAVLKMYGNLVSKKIPNNYGKCIAILDGDQEETQKVKEIMEKDEETVSNWKRSDIKFMPFLSPERYIREKVYKSTSKFSDLFQEELEPEQKQNLSKTIETARKDEVTEVCKYIRTLITALEEYKEKNPSLVDDISECTRKLNSLKVRLEQTDDDVVYSNLLTAETAIEEIRLNAGGELSNVLKLKESKGQKAPRKIWSGKFLSEKITKDIFDGDKDNYEKKVSQAILKYSQELLKRAAQENENELLSQEREKWESFSNSLDEILSV